MAIGRRLPIALLGRAKAGPLRDLKESEGFSLQRPKKMIADQRHRLMSRVSVFTSRRSISRPPDWIKTNAKGEKPALLKVAINWASPGLEALRAKVLGTMALRQKTVDISG
jgi:hypothetical protein